MADLLEIDSVIKSYNQRQVLTDIYLKCETGDIIGMLGRNGSGKTTLLKILFGTLSAERKFIRINGKVHNSAYKTLNEICYLPQHQFLPMHLAVEKAVALFLGKVPVSFFIQDETLAPVRKHKISDLGGGLLRYLEIKLLLGTHSRFVLLDEPFSGISPLLVQHIKELITASAATKGIILTDHDYRNVLDVANRYCLIFDGGIKPITDKSELITWGYVPGSKD